MKRIIPVLLAVLLLSACGGAAQPKASPTPTLSKNPYGSGFKVSPPADSDIVLTIKGASTINFTMKQLRDLGTSQITIREPFVKAKQTFGVVNFKSLFDSLKIAQNASLNTVALNDYAFKATAKDFFNNQALLAVSLNNAPIPMDAGGPIRLVFNTSSKWFTNLDAWNWSLRSVEIA